MASESENTRENDSVTLEGGTYEIIRNRLLSDRTNLVERLEKLNNKRKEVFGSIEWNLISTERITTQNNCVARDMCEIGHNRFIFGFNVHIGLKTETSLTDVFAIYEYKDHIFHELSIDLIKDSRFEEDFKSLYKYYKNTTFVKFSIISPHIFMVFRTGYSVTDIKTFKWLLDDNGLKYIDNRSDHEFTFPAQHEFEWVRTHRDLHRDGQHPHISIEDRVFVESIGGGITFKVEDNTDSGEGIYEEPVEHKDQTLDDAEILYAVPGKNIILLKIRPYQEEDFRYFIFNDKVNEVSRVDEIAHSCVLLPDGHGIIFSKGYYLETGEIKLFESELTDMLFESKLSSTNGEDFLYVFYNRLSGDYILLSYNLIEQKVENPILCNGYSIFDMGEIIIFKTKDEATKHHAIQIWQTPYVKTELAAVQQTDSALYKIGNADIVRCMSECHEISRLLIKEDTYAELYMDIVKKSIDVNDSYFWIDYEETFNLKEIIEKISQEAKSAIDEFEKVIKLKRTAKSETNRIREKVNKVVSAIDYAELNDVNVFVRSLAELRTVRGEIISLKDVRYVDLPEIEHLEEDVKDQTDKLSRLCVEFFMGDDALVPYESRIKDLDSSIESVEKVTDADSISENIKSTFIELDMLIDIVENLKIEDSTVTTKIIDSISEIYSTLNQVKGKLKKKRLSLQSEESTLQFNAQIRLLSQSIVNYLDMSDTAEKCDEFLTKLIIQIEELEAKFSDFDEFVEQLINKRDEIYKAFEAKKLNLIEAANKKANSLMNTGQRILSGIKNRVDSMDDLSAIHGYFAADLMVEKIRNIIAELHAIGQSVKGDDLEGRLKTTREDAVRQLKDRKELYVDGHDVIQFGVHKFSVNTQPLDVTIINREGKMYVHLTGTSFFEEITNEEFLSTRSVWEQELPSENDELYRGEYLAYKMLIDIESWPKDDKESIFLLCEKNDESADKELSERVLSFMGPRYSEGYVKGVNNIDGAKILKSLLIIHKKIGLLRYQSQARACALLFWHLYDKNDKSLLNSKLKGYGIMSNVFSHEGIQTSYIDHLNSLIHNFIGNTQLFSLSCANDASQYLFYELTKGKEPVISKEAHNICTGFEKHLKTKLHLERFNTLRKELSSDPISEYQLVRDWINGYTLNLESKDELLDYIDEASVTIFTNSYKHTNVVDAAISQDMKGMMATHKVIKDSVYHLNYNKFIQKLQSYETHILPVFNKYTTLKKELIEHYRDLLRLDEFKPKILTSFVRNRLIDKVYLPLIGDNLAKQIGVVGAAKRTDLMGLLLLISPPGYGKTTLMEYIANRLGVIFMKINGPAIGHNVTSLDPAEAPNASAREEIERLNLAFEMGDNIMIYLDDIQHCNPELLQKFISLCDGQRKIEGVYKSKTKTYDLRGRKVMVVMAGNPYTESGEKFQIPDMLSNRADTYNLGDIIGGSAEDFKLSYIENSLTSNPVLNNLATHSKKDIYSFVQVSESGSKEGIEFEGNYSVEQINEIASVIKKLITIREVILKVNKEYINSASQADEYRTEPPFKLQGSYRNMNRIAEKVLPVMNDDEIQVLINSHYENESQTLTTGAESNLLKFKELNNSLSKKEKQRFDDIKKTFSKNLMFKNLDENDPVSQVVLQLTTLTDGLDSIKREISKFVGTSEAPKVEILNRVHMPKVFSSILQHQIKVMNNWLSPLLQNSGNQTKEIKELIKNIKKMELSYNSLYDIVKRQIESQEDGDE